MEAGHRLAERQDLAPYVPKDLLEWLGENLKGADLAVSGKCIALNSKAETDMQLKGLTENWVSNTRKPLVANFQQHGFAFLGDCVVPRVEFSQGFIVRIPKITLGGYIAVFELPKDKKAPINNNLEGDIVSGIKTGYFQVNLDQGFSGKQKFIESLAGWSSKAVEGLGVEHLDLKPVENWGVKGLRNILLVATRKQH